VGSRPPQPGASRSGAAFGCERRHDDADKIALHGRGQPAAGASRAREVLRKTSEKAAIALPLCTTTLGVPRALRSQRCHPPGKAAIFIPPVPNTFTACSLFSGIGGIELGLASAGHHVNLFVERDECARRVLADRFPGVELHDDITTLGALPAGTDLVTAGFPCQDISQAGRVKGLAGEQSGLVEHVFRLVERQRVPWLLLENVAFLLRAKRGRVLDEILTRIEGLGYRWAYRVLDSQAFGVHQRRERVFLVASRDDDPRSVLFDGDITPSHSRRRNPAVGFYWSEGNNGLGWAIDAVPPLKSGSSSGGAIPPAILLPTGEVIKPNIRDAERFQGFESGWTRAARSERERWRLVGNAVTAPVAAWIGSKLAAHKSSVATESFALDASSAWPRAAFNVDGTRRGCDLSATPLWAPRPRLERALQHEGVPLSARATLGFLTRARASTLKLPEGFLERLEVHLERVRTAA
jgi:DNA (cytosine-5)-methyltransferase 1